MKFKMLLFDLGGVIIDILPEKSIKEFSKLSKHSQEMFRDIDYREKNNIENVAIVRIEQLFPLPVKLIISEIKKFSNATDIVWAQEEPRNMGAWNHIQTYHPIAKNMRPATRRFYGSTASGSYTRFERRHNQVIEYVFDKTKNNFRK